jgi:hypothetical protein
MQNVNFMPFFIISINAYTCKFPIYDGTADAIFKVDYRINQFNSLIGAFRRDLSDRERKSCLKEVENNYEKSAFIASYVCQFSEDKKLKAYARCLRQTAGFMLAAARPVEADIEYTEVSIAEQIKTLKQLSSENASEDKKSILRSLGNKYFIINNFIEFTKTDDKQFQNKMRTDAESIKELFDSLGLKVEEQV